MELTIIWLYGLFALAGLLLQNFLRGSIRTVIYPLSFVIGVIAGFTSNYFLLSFNIGMITRAAIGGYWNCVAVETLCLVTGVLIGFFVI